MTDAFYQVGVLGSVLFGAIVGSFLNALVFRVRVGETMMGRSHCMGCRHTLAAWDLVPVLSYVWLRGKCRYCGAGVSVQYPLVEVAGAVLSLGVFLVNPAPGAFLLAFFFWMTVLFAAVYDLRFQELPNDALLVIGVLGLASVFFSCDAGACHVLMPQWLPLLAGPLVALPLLAISAVSRERAMGWGDGLLELGIGWLLGVSGGYSALFIGVWTGAAAGLLLVAGERLLAMHRGGSVRGHKGVTMKSKLPFAPFLMIGAVAVYFFHGNFFAVLLGGW